MLSGTLNKHLQYVSRSNVYVARTVIRAMSGDRYFVNDLKPLVITEHEENPALVREILKAAAIALKVTWVRCQTLVERYHKPRMWLSPPFIVACSYSTCSISSTAGTWLCIVADCAVTDPSFQPARTFQLPYE